MTDPAPVSTALPDVTLLHHREGADGSVVVLDFVTFDQKGSAADLVAEGLPGHRILFADPVSDVAAAGRFVPLAELAAAYAGAILGLDAPPAVLAGYCSAAPLAVRVREMLLDAGTDVPLLLVAPGFPVRSQVEESLDEVLSSLGAPGTRVDLPADRDGARATVERLLGEGLTNAVARMGLEGLEAEILVEDLGARYRGWLGYLLSTVGEQPAADAGAWHVVALDEAHSMPDEGWPSGSVVRTSAVLREDFLTDPRSADDVAAALSDLVAAAR